MKILIVFCILLPLAFAVQKSTETLDSFYDDQVNYSVFSGRVSDRDQNSNVLKVSSENNNIKFFRAGDQVRFQVAMVKGGFCEGYVSDVENNFFVIHVKNIYPCWKEGEYFRRGTQLSFYSETLAQRVRDASVYRVILLKRREDFFKQLNGINNFLDSFDQHRILVAADYDAKILQLQKSKEQALADMLVRKNDQIKLQKELIYRLDSLDSELDHYRVEKAELFYDRWHLDHDLGLPVDRRPPRR